MIHHHPGALGLDGHVGEHGLHHGHVDEPRVELATLLGVGHRLVQGALHDAHRERGNEGAREVQGVQRDGHAAALLADDGAGRHAHVVEHHLARVRQAKAHLVLLGAGGKARCAPVDEKARDTASASGRVGLGEDHVDARDRAVGDEGLGAVQHILVALAHRRGAHGGHIRPRAGLRQAEGGEPSLLGQLNEVARLLGSAVQHDVAEGHEVGDEGVGVSGIHARQLLEHHGAGFVGQAHSAVLLGNLHHVKPQIEAPLEQLHRTLACLVGGGHMGQDLVLGHIAHERDELFLLVGVG